MDVLPLRLLKLRFLLFYLYQTKTRKCGKGLNFQSYHEERFRASPCSEAALEEQKAITNTLYPIELEGKRKEKLERF